MKKMIAGICSGVLMAGVLVMGSIYAEHPFMIMADESMYNETVPTGGAVTAKTTVTFQKENETVPYSWHKVIRATAKSKSGKKVATKKYSAKNTLVWKAPKKGTYKVTVYVKNGKGVEVFKTKTLKIKKVN